MRAAIETCYDNEVAQMHASADFDGATSVWSAICCEAQHLLAEEPILGSFYHATIFNHEDFGSALSFYLANKLDSGVLLVMLICEVICEAMAADPSILKAAEIDIIATRTRDPACSHYSTPFLYFKGFHVLQSYCVAYWFWHQDCRPLAVFIQNQVSVIFVVDIYPAASLGSGIMLDHAIGIVMGETSVVEDDVSIFHEVTLGGTGKISGDRHPKIRRGVLLAAGAKIIGNIEVGEGAKVGAGFVVLEDVLPHVTVAGVLAKIVGCSCCDSPALDMNHGLAD